jgi:hypothetical protein
MPNARARARDNLGRLPDAAIVLLVAPLLAQFVRALIQTGAGQMGFANANLLGRIAQYAIIAFAVIVAINQIGIAANLVNTLFIGVVAAVSLALGLSFGLGGRDVAARITEQWYASSQQAAGRAQGAMQGKEHNSTRGTPPS